MNSSLKEDGQEKGEKGGRKKGRRGGSTIIIRVWGAFGAFPAHPCHLIFWGPSRLLTIIFILLFGMLANLHKDVYLGGKQPWNPFFFFFF